MIGLMGKTIKLVEKEIRRLESKRKHINNMARHCFDNDYEVEYQLWHEKREKTRMQIILFNEELDILCKRYKKVEEF
tara:strand:- start:8215 stop:8445 length:231 start_codon:yes stop_codon:yes gene_type:complete